METYISKQRVTIYFAAESPTAASIKAKVAAFSELTGVEPVVEIGAESISGATRERGIFSMGDQFWTLVQHVGRAYLTVKLPWAKGTLDINPSRAEDVRIRLSVPGAVYS